MGGRTEMELVIVELVGRLCIYNKAFLKSREYLWIFGVSSVV